MAIGLGLPKLYVGAPHSELDDENVSTVSSLRIDTLLRCLVLSPQANLWPITCTYGAPLTIDRAYGCIHIDVVIGTMYIAMISTRV